jgi:hypothetical protein
LGLQLLAIGGFLSLLGTSQSAAATNYFNWGVESLRLDYGVNGPGMYNVIPRGATIIDCTVRHSGNCSMRLNVIGNDSGNQAMGIDSIAHNPPYSWNAVGSQALYYKWWMRIMSGFSWGSNGKAISHITGSPGAQSFWNGMVHKDGFAIEECAAVGCRTNTGASPPGDELLFVPYNFVADSVWHEYIVKFKPNTSGSCTVGTNCDGQFQAWVDGVSVGTYNNFKAVDSAHDATMQEWTGSWMVRPFFSMSATASDGGTIYLDDFSIDNVYSSSTGGGHTTLSPPTNLHLH